MALVLVWPTRTRKPTRTRARHAAGSDAANRATGAQGGALAGPRRPLDKVCPGDGRPPRSFPRKAANLLALRPAPLDLHPCRVLRDACGPVLRVLDAQRLETGVGR